MEIRKAPLFGMAGLSDMFYNQGLKHTYEMPKWMSAIGLDAFEYSFGRGVNIGETSALKIGDAISKYDIAISGHAPYFINYGNSTDEAIAKSHNYVSDALVAVHAMGGHRITVHVGVADKTISREQSIDRVKGNLIKLVDKLQAKNINDYVLCLETMGKYSQIGSYQEICSLCELDDRFIPCIDFGHINCILQGALKTRDDFLTVFDYCIDKLGLDKVKNCHIHFSKIQYGKAGEIKHLDFDDTEFGPNFEPLAEALVERGLTPTIICESKNTRAEDALYMKNFYTSIAR